MDEGETKVSPLIPYSKRKKKDKRTIKADSSEYDGIKFRSKLEVYCYKKLKENNIKAEYESTTFTILDKFTYNEESIRQMTYTPDFVGKDFIIECKGFANFSFPLRWKIFKSYLFRNKFKFDLYLPHNHKEVDETIIRIKERQNEKKTKKISTKRYKQFFPFLA